MNTRQTNDLRRSNTTILGHDADGKEWDRFWREAAWRAAVLTTRHDGTGYLSVAPERDDPEERLYRVRPRDYNRRPVRSSLRKSVTGWAWEPVGTEASRG